MSNCEDPTKKFINKHDEVVDDALRGLTDFNPSATLLPNCHRVVIRRQDPSGNEKQRPNKVALIAGGGSGHEPYAAGYVGKGMLTAAVAGNVFASPPSSHVQAALQGARSGAGSILFVINYTGDRLNFGLAVERFKAEGNDVRVVTIGDDIAIDTSKTRTGARGLAGSVLIIKMAGALSEQGENIDEIERLSTEARKNIRTIGCSLMGCSIPGKALLSNIPTNQYELGLGIHGEPGKERIKMQTSCEIVNRLMDELIGSSTKTHEVAIMLNNLGSVSQIEMDILKRDVLHWCADHKVKLVRFYCGAFMTSLDTHGISLTVLDLVNPRFIELLDADAECPGWRMGITLKPKLEPSMKTDKSTYEGEEEESAVGETGTEISRLWTALSKVCKEMKIREDELNRLDGKAGDGDCGSTFKSAADGIEKALKEHKICLSNVKECFEEVAVIFENNVGGTSGAIYALFLSVFGRELDEASNSWNVGNALKVATEAVEKYGGAREGDRTMIDTLRSAIKVIDRSEHIDWNKVVSAAEGGAQATARMRAAAGRASYTSEEAQTDPDAGAMAMAYWMRTILNVFT